jgi:hypothetical protein
VLKRRLNAQTSARVPCLYDSPGYYRAVLQLDFPSENWQHNALAILNLTAYNWFRSPHVTTYLGRKRHRANSLTVSKLTASGLLDRQMSQNPWRFSLLQIINQYVSGSCYYYHYYYYYYSVTMFGIERCQKGDNVDGMSVTTCMELQSLSPSLSRARRVRLGVLRACTTSTYKQHRL